MNPSLDARVRTRQLYNINKSRSSNTFATSTGVLVYCVCPESIRSGSCILITESTMEVLSSLISSPLDAVSGLVEAITPGAPAATAAGDAPNETFTEDTLRMILHNIFTGDARLQSQMLTKYWSPEASYCLNEGVMELPDRDSLAQLLRGVQLLATVEPEILDTISTTDRAVILLNLSVKYRLFPLTWPRSMQVQVPTTLTLSFAPDNSIMTSTDYVITEFKQDMSLPDLLWWNPVWPLVKSRLWEPLSGRVLTGFVKLGEPLACRLKMYVRPSDKYLAASSPDIPSSSGQSQTGSKIFSPATDAQVTTPTPLTAAVAESAGSPPQGAAVAESAGSPPQSVAVAESAGPPPQAPAVTPPAAELSSFPPPDLDVADP